MIMTHLPSACPAFERQGIFTKSLFSLGKIRAEPLSYLIRHSGGFEGRATDAGKHDMAFRDHIRLALLDYFKAQRERARAEARDIGPDFYQVIKHERFVKIEMYLHSRQPDVETVEGVRIRKPDRAKKLGLGYLEKAQKLAVINDPCAVCVRPSDVFFDGEAFMHDEAAKSTFSYLLFRAGGILSVASSLAGGPVISKDSSSD